jgi:hypothetical protein
MKSLAFQFEVTIPLRMSVCKELYQKGWRYFLPRISFPISPIFPVFLSLSNGSSFPEAVMEHLRDIVLFQILGFILIPAWENLSLRRIIQNEPELGQIQMVTLTAEGFGMRTNAAQSMTRWSAITRVVEGKQHFLFYTAPQSALYLPLVAMSMTDLPRVRNFIVNHCTAPLELNFDVRSRR